MEFVAFLLGIGVILLLIRMGFDHSDIVRLRGKLAVSESECNQLKHKYDQKFKDWAHVVNEYKKVKFENDWLKHHSQSERKQASDDISVNVSFTQEDLKRMKHYLHPDKHNGKTNDLFVKVNESLK